ncbi:hypothetical protein BRD56_02465 [Thermoplasmatales archaeon SW_10_69_26]|nr:MAG: hypothetical protein BRD56_02465 [Thermoplasmatales archaeon SW_10_69_26]
MLTMTLPVATASHLSTGSLTTIGMQPRESPDDPSVPGETVGDESTPYGIGTSQDCYEADAQEAQGAITAEEICGDLVYNGGSELTRFSPTDQEILTDEIEIFDAQIGYSQAGGFLWKTCQPWCLSAAGVDAGDPLWTGFHTVGGTAGITGSPDESDREDDGRYQIITQDATAPNAFTFVQNEAGVWKMDGWNGPPPAMERVIAFLEDEEGKFIDSDRLDEIVENADLSTEADAKICGFDPGTEYDSSQAQSFCQIRLTDQTAGEDGTVDPTFDGYDNKCNSPTYVCAAQGPYWRSYNVGLAGTFGGQLTQTDIHHLHFVVAPNPAECQNLAPGHLDFDGDTGSIPYLAHDLDVYTTATDTARGPSASLDGTTDYASALSREVQGGTVPDVPDVPAVPSEVTDAVDTATDGVTESSMIEPNNGDPVAGIPDNSRNVISEERDDPSSCQDLVDNEDKDTRDPWVNVLDSQVDGYQDDGLGPGVGAYGSSGTQDASNRPGPSYFRTEGKVGVFADKNDDGDYDQNAFGQGVYQADDIQSIGAYPMLWDMQVDDEGTAGGGCPTGPGGSLASEMLDAGYGKHTALAQAIYLREPTTFTDVNTFPAPDDDAEDPQTQPYLDGNNIYVMTNDAGRTLWDGDVAATAGNPVDNAIDALVDDLRSYVIDEHAANEGTLDVHQPGAVFDRGSDFGTQCGEPTGGFTGELAFQHSCQGVSCEGDTIATMYTFEVTGSDVYADTIGSETVPPLRINDDVYGFGTGQHTWFDLDPFDGDADRNENQMGPPAN